MIDIKELRRLAQAATPGPWYVTGKLTRYVEARIDGGLIQEVAACGPTKADGGYGPQQEANARLIAAANPTAISELLDRLEATEKERDAMRAKIARMEQQKPVAWMLNCQTLGGDTGWILSWTQSGAGLCNRLSGEENEKKLYALPGAQPQLNEIKLALQRALELGKRETWTGVRKHRSWEDQREEQQCWDKVWSLLGAKGESE